MRALPNQSRVAVIVGGLILAAMWQLWHSGTHGPARLLAEQPNAPQGGAAATRQDLQEVKGKLPDQSHSMMDVDYHFSNLWFAAREENWPLADFYWKETMSHIKWAVRIIPIRKDSVGREVGLEDIRQSIEQSPFMQVGKAIENRNVAEFETAYRYTLEGCYGCHKAADKPYLRPHVPERPASTIINFDPDATWPR